MIQSIITITILYILLFPSQLFCCDIYINCDNTTYIYVSKLLDLPKEFGVSPGKYAIYVYLTKKKFDFAELSKTCHGSVTVRSSETFIAKQEFERVAGGAVLYFKDSFFEAFSSARSICPEKVDPDLRY